MEDCRLNNEEPLMYSQFCYYIQQDEQRCHATMYVNRKSAEQIEVDCGLVILLHIKAGLNIRILTMWKSCYKQISINDFSGVLIYNWHCRTTPVNFAYYTWLMYEIIGEIVRKNMIGITFAERYISHRKGFFNNTLFLIFLSEQFQGYTFLFQFCMNIWVIRLLKKIFCWKLIREKHLINFFLWFVFNIFVS